MKACESLKVDTVRDGEFKYILVWSRFYDIRTSFHNVFFHHFNISVFEIIKLNRPKPGMNLIITYLRFKTEHRSKLRA